MACAKGIIILSKIAAINVVEETLNLELENEWSSNRKINISFKSEIRKA